MKMRAKVNRKNKPRSMQTTKHKIERQTMQTYNDRTVDSTQEVPEIPDMLERALIYAVEEGKKRMAAGEELVPFTCLIVKDKVFLESHPAETAEDCFALARHTVSGARGATCYAFCYDGYVDSESGMLDCVIAEGGVPGTQDGYAVGCIYKTPDEAGAGAEGSSSAEEAGASLATEKDASVSADQDENAPASSPDVTFEEEIIYIGEAPNFMEKLKESTEYANEEIDSKYITGAGFEDADAQESAAARVEGTDE